jgi:hypothetical protein
MQYQLKPIIRILHYDYSTNNTLYESE